MFGQEAESGQRILALVVDKTIQTIPERIDLVTGEIKVRTKAVYRIQIHFEASKIRRG